MQAPERQPESEGQTFPHLPQLLSSMFPSMHAPLQRRLPAVHPHLPSLQNCSPGQLLPHLPQLLISKLTSTHLPPQSVSPCKHPHVPLKQESPGGQTFPHEPQSDSSDFKSVQCVPFSQMVMSLGHEVELGAADKPPTIPKFNKVRTDKIIQLTCIVFNSHRLT